MTQFTTSLQQIESMDAEEYSAFLAYGDPEDVSELTVEETVIIDGYSLLYPEVTM